MKKRTNDSWLEYINNRFKKSLIADSKNAFSRKRLNYKIAFIGDDLEGYIQVAQLKTKKGYYTWLVSYKAARRYMMLIGAHELANDCLDRLNLEEMSVSQVIDALISHFDFRKSIGLPPTRFLFNTRIEDKNKLFQKHKHILVMKDCYPPWPLIGYASLLKEKKDEQTKKQRLGKEASNDMD